MYLNAYILENLSFSNVVPLYTIHFFFRNNGEKCQNLTLVRLENLKPSLIWGHPILLKNVCAGSVSPYSTFIGYIQIKKQTSKA